MNINFKYKYKGKKKIYEYEIINEIKDKKNQPVKNIKEVAGCFEAQIPFFLGEIIKNNIVTYVFKYKLSDEIWNEFNNEVTVEIIKNGYKRKGAL